MIRNCKEIQASKYLTFPVIFPSLKRIETSKHLGKEKAFFKVSKGMDLIEILARNIGKGNAFSKKNPQISLYYSNSQRS